ncbi:MAG: hypothetical protein IJY25_06255 [Bacilli bacterium]|nr:hypothetical protein [Bacilli bacterium]
MKKKFNRSVIIILIVFILILVGCIMLVVAKKESKNLSDTVSYKGKTYVNLEYNTDIFTYGFNSNDYYEEDMIHHITHDKWDIVYFNGDLFVLDKQVDEAIKYYSNDNNYEWFIIFDKDESEIKVPIYISKEELKYLYNMENMEKNETMKFEEIKQFASITKISKDKLVYSIISLAYYKDSWYWKTEIIDDNQEDNYEYVIILPDTLNKKIFDLARDI